MVAADWRGVGKEEEDHWVMEGGGPDPNDDGKGTGEVQGAPLPDPIELRVGVLRVVR